MAGIITDVKSDIQRLKELKSAIDDVKKSIASIDIKVDINITKGLEAKLKSLTSQYDELATKIVKTEAEIALSAKNIVVASDKILQAQNALSKVSNAAQKPNNNQSNNSVEIINIQAQAKVYEELKGEIDKVTGSRAWNIKRMMEESNSIRLINAEIKEITKSQGNSAALSSSQQRRLEQLNNSLLTHKTALAEVRQNLNNNVKLDNLAATSMNGLSQSLSRMRVAYRELTEEERNSPFGKDLLASINQADMEIKELDATIGNHQRNVGNYKAQWNGLSMSIQQVGRELPSLAYGPKVFFSAISNNLPILADEIKRARTEYDLLKKTGQQAIPVWKQIASSLFSWQSALTVGVTLLTLYGDKIVDWASSLFTAKKALSETYQTTEEFQKSVSKTSGSVITKLERLSEGWKQLGGDIDAQKKYIFDNKDAINSMGVSVNDAAEAERIFNSHKDTFILGILQRAKAAATMELAAEEYKKAVQKMMEAETMPDKSSQFIQTSSFGTGYWIETENIKKKRTKKEADDLFKSGSELVQKYTQFSEEERKTLESIGIKTTETIIESSVEAIEAAITSKQQSLKKVTDPKEYARIKAEIKAEQSKLDAITGKPDKESLKRLKLQQDLSRSILDSELKLQSGRIAAMEDGRAKRIALAEQETKDTIAAIQKEKQEYQKKIKETKGKEDPTVIKTFDSRELAAKTKEKADIARIEKEYAEEYKQRTKALTDVFLNEEQRKLSAIKTRYAEERKWANEQLKTGGMTKDEHKSYTTNIDKAQQQETYRALLDNLNDYKQKEKDLRDKWDTDIAVAVESKDAYLVAKLMEGKQKALSALNGQMLQESDEWQQLFGNLDNLTVQQLEKLSNTIKEKAKGLKLNPIDAQAVTNSLKEVDEKIRTMNPFGLLSKHLKQYKKAEDDVTKKNALKEMFRDTAASIDMVKGGFDAIVGGLNEMGLAGDEATQQLLSDLSNLMGSASQLATSIASANPVGIIQGSIGVLTSVFNFFNSDKRHEKKIKALQDQIDTLDKSYERLGDSIEKAYSKDASNLIGQQNKLLEQQKVLIQNQIKEEEDKKKTDNDRIKEWRDQIDEINNTIADNKEAGKDAIFGSDIKSAIDDFANAYADAWAAGEDKAQSAKDLVRKMIRNMVTESIKAAASDPMKAIREKLLEFWSDDYISGWEQDYLDRKAQELADDLDRKFGWADKYFNTGNAVEEDDGRTASSKGVGSISQDSADIIDGKMSTQLIFLDRTLVQVTGIADQMRFIYDLQTRGWKNVEAIKDLSGKVSENTAKVAEISGRIEALSEKIEANTKSAASGIKTINDKGILMRSR